MRTAFYRTSSILMLSFLLMTSQALPVFAQDMDVQSLIDRIDRLERDIRALNIHIATGATGTPPELASAPVDEFSSSGSFLGRAAVARIDARIASLENDVRVATGAMEDIDHRIFQISSQMEKLVSDIDFRLSTLEQNVANQPMANARQNGQNMNQGTNIVMNNQMGTTVAAPTTEMQMNTAPTVGTVTTVITQSESGVIGTITETQLDQISTEAATKNEQADQNDVSSVPQVSQVQTQNQNATQTASVPGATTPTSQEEYTYAFGLLRQAKYDDAASALQQFINNYSEDPLAVNARYWLGETYYVRSQFVKAAEVFFEGYQTNPAGAKAPDSLLKLGMSLSNLGKQPEACAAFAKLASEFANASASVRTTMERERIRNEC